MDRRGVGVRRDAAPDLVRRRRPCCRCGNDKGLADDQIRRVEHNKRGAARHRHATGRHLLAWCRWLAGLILPRHTIGHPGYCRRLLLNHRITRARRKRHTLPGKAENNPQQEEVAKQQFEHGVGYVLRTFGCQFGLQPIKVTFTNKTQRTAAKDIAL